MQNICNLDHISTLSLGEACMALYMVSCIMRKRFLKSEANERSDQLAHSLSDQTQHCLHGASTVSRLSREDIDASYHTEQTRRLVSILTVFKTQKTGFLRMGQFNA